MISRLYFTAKFNKPIPEDIPTTPGSFTIMRDIGGNDEFRLEEITFDFEYSATTAEGDIRKFEMWGLDIGSFPESEYITPEIFSKIIGFSDIFIDLDEADDDVEIESIVDMEIVFDEGSTITIDLHDDILKRYNKEYLNQ